MPRLVAITGGKVTNIAWNVNEEPSRAEIDQALIDQWTGQYDEVVLVSDGSVRAEVNDQWDGSTGVDPATLVELKARCCARVNTRTRDLIQLGFEWPPASGQKFSLSDTAQRNLSELDKLRDSGLVTYPFLMSTIDDAAVYSVDSTTTLHNMYLTALGRVQYCYGTGNALKVAINAAVNKLELDAVVDSR